jgi:perosamine synthetase
MIARRRIYTLAGEIERISACVRRSDAGDPALIEQWEQALADYIGVPHAAIVNSGRRGLVLTLSHFGLGTGDELIIPAYTFGELLPPVQQLGIIPVSADIDAKSLCITPETIQSRITSRTKAILALHTFGVPCDVEGILEVGRRHSLPVIEDCAHSLGATVDQRQTGSFGDAAFFSFEAIKPVNTFGGGLVVSRDERLIQTIRRESAAASNNLGLLGSKVRSARLEQFLFDKRLACPLLYVLATPSLKRLGSWLYHRTQHSVPVSSGYTPLQAEIGLKKLETLDERISERAKASELLSSLLRSEINVHKATEGCRSSQYCFVVELPVPAARIRKRMLLKGVDAGIEDELTDNCAVILGDNDCHTVNSVYPRLLSLPLFDGITEKEIRRVADVLNGTL